MADSLITKTALALALKELMRAEPFDKISISKICVACGMSRKSFYYHFRDKYDLLNWIFDSEISAFVSRIPELASYEEYMRLLLEFDIYLYDNREFYRTALMTGGQNSFSEHFHSRSRPILQLFVKNITGIEEVDDFFLDVLADAVLSALRRWFTEPDCMTPEEFTSRLHNMTYALVDGLSKQFVSPQQP